MYISAFPTLSLKHILTNRNNRIFPDGLNSKGISLHFRASYGLWDAMKRFNMDELDNILVPAYHCGIEIEALLNAGVKVVFYNIKENLEADLEDIKRKTDKRTKAVFIIHYFGFSQPMDEIKKMCEANNLYLIEDCAHAFLTNHNGRPVGGFGDFSIFSMKKSFPIPDGGVLVINSNSSPRIKAQGRRPHTLSVLRGIIILLLERVKISSGSLYRGIDLFFAQPLRLVLRSLKKIPSSAFEIKTSTDLDFDLNLGNVDMSGISKRIIGNIDFDAVFKKRRENFRFLLNALPETRLFEPIFDDLPEGVCPLFFPVLVEERDYIQDRLRKNGICTFIFGKHPHRLLQAENFPIADYFSKHNLCIPIHQDIDLTRINYISDVIKKELHCMPQMDISKNRHNLAHVSIKSERQDPCLNNSLF